MVYFVTDEKKTVLVVQDFFDIDMTYMEFTGKFDERIFMDINDLYFSNDGTKIIINHSDINEKEEIVEECFDLY